MPKHSTQRPYILEKHCAHVKRFSIETASYPDHSLFHTNNVSLATVNYKMGFEVWDKMEKKYWRYDRPNPDFSPK